MHRESLLLYFDYNYTVHSNKPLISIMFFSVTIAWIQTSCCIKSSEGFERFQYWVVSFTWRDENEIYEIKDISVSNKRKKIIGIEKEYQGWGREREKVSHYNDYTELLYNSSTCMIVSLLFFDREVVVELEREQLARNRLQEQLQVSQSWL